MRTLAILLIASVLLAQMQPQQIINQIMNELKRIGNTLITLRDTIIKFVIKNQIKIVMFLTGLPLILFGYWGAKLIFYTMRDIGNLITKWKVLSKAEKRWYYWKIGWKIFAFIIVSVLIIVDAMVIAWMSQFKTVNEMLAALEQLRKKTNPFEPILKILERLRLRR